MFDVKISQGILKNQDQEQKYQQQSVMHQINLESNIKNNAVVKNSQVRGQVSFKFRMQTKILYSSNLNSNLRVNISDINRSDINLQNRVYYTINLSSKTQKYSYQVSKLLEQQVFQKLKELKIYFSNWELINSTYYDTMVEAIMKLPNLKLFTLVVQDIHSYTSFKVLGNKFKAVVQRQWWITDKQCQIDD